MGIFTFNYDKPGKGVRKDEPEKKGLALYFDIVIHKFTKLVCAGCLYTITSILWLAVLYVLSGILLTATGIIGNAEDMSVFILQFALTFLIFTLWGSGPASAVYSYVARCFARGEHVWLMSDGKDKLKENFKQGIIVAIVDVFVLLLGLNAIRFYHWYYEQTGSMVWLALSAVLAGIFVMYTMMHPYLYQLMVTFECKTTTLYKNAFIITMAKLPINFVLTVLSAVIVMLLYSFITPIIASILLMVFVLIITRFPAELYAARVIKKTFLDNQKTEQALEGEE